MLTPPLNCARPLLIPSIAASAPRWSILAAGTCPSSIPASWPSTWPSRTARRPLRRQPHGRNRSARPTALELVQHVTCNDAAKLVVGQAHYSGLMTPAARLWTTCWCTKSRTRTISFASTPAIRTTISTTSSPTTRFDAEVENAGPRYSQLAIQGPKALGSCSAHAQPDRRASVLSFYLWRGGRR